MWKVSDVDSRGILSQIIGGEFIRRADIMDRQTTAWQRLWEFRPSTRDRTHVVEVGVVKRGIGAYVRRRGQGGLFYWISEDEGGCTSAACIWPLVPRQEARKGLESRLCGYNNPPWYTLTSQKQKFQFPCLLWNCLSFWSHLCLTLLVILKSQFLLVF